MRPSAPAPPARVPPCRASRAAGGGGRAPGGPGHHQPGGADPQRGALAALDARGRKRHPPPGDLPAGGAAELWTRQGGGRVRGGGHRRHGGHEHAFPAPALRGGERAAHLVPGAAAAVGVAPAGGQGARGRGLPGAAGVPRVQPLSLLPLPLCAGEAALHAAPGVPVAVRRGHVPRVEARPDGLPARGRGDAAAVGHGVDQQQAAGGVRELPSQEPPAAVAVGAQALHVRTHRRGHGVRHARVAVRDGECDGRARVGADL
mmetsp:Transcript_42505/g.136365  ORF Transcript_42505/g.136365 Transcript_42505/m.136365 type:complete len:260 (-) Transcript_42505:819-1598(-)